MSFSAFYLMALAGCGEGRVDGPDEGAPPADTSGADDTAPVDPAETADTGGALTDTGVCEISFPELDAPTDTGDAGDTGDTGDTGDAGAGVELDTTGLVAWWSLDGDWSDGWSDEALVPIREGGFADSDVAAGGGNQSYGPTGETSDNGAFSESLTELGTEDGVTMAGWYFKPDNNISGTLVGFGGHDWGLPSLGVYDSWGFLYAGGGETTDRNLAQYDRPDGGCWHHLAAVFPPGFDSGEPYRFYIDGVAVEPINETKAELEGTGLFGEAFRVGTFANTSGDQMRVDEVSLWSRALSDEEVAALAVATGGGEVCPGAVADWEPGPRCVFDEDESLWVSSSSEVRVLTDDTIAVVTDPTDWLLDEVADNCGAYLDAMEEHIDDVEDWWAEYTYAFALVENKARYWPQILDAFADPEHLLVAGCDEAPQAPLSASHWPVAMRETAVPRLGEAEGVQRTGYADVSVVSFLTLPFTLEPGEPYAVRDAWGNRVDFSYDEDETISWAIKVDQLGYLADAPSKYAYLGAWTAGPMDLSRFDGAAFDVVREGDGAVAYSGIVSHRMDDPDYEGESVYELEFSALTEAGAYYIRLPGAGRSWTFTIGADALGEAFYVHARGLYHNRCGAELTEAHTPWTRGDIHQTYRGGFPPDADDYDDHSADGWGFLDESGDYVAYTAFEAIAATATDERLEGVTGGWHDAADYDRRTYHFLAVQDLLVSYFMFPDNFTDGQLNIPESGDGIPDVLDEARWGVDVWRAAQEADGGVGTWIEATSHPSVDDPGADDQPYYLALPTRNASLQYARYAAMLGRALAEAGFADEAAGYIDSAAAAYDYGTDPDVRVSTSWESDGETHRWIEPPEPDEERRLWALTELWLATGDAVYENELWTAEMDDVFNNVITQLWWQNRLFFAVPVALEADRLPAGWGDAAASAITEQADTWVSYQGGHAYRRIWWGDSHGYFELAGWGNDVFMPLRSLVAAWRLTDDDAYRGAALHGLSYHQGLNGLGHVNTTGLGDHRAGAALHLPSWADDIAEPSPGITLYGNRVATSWAASERVYGLSVDARSDPAFDGVEIALMPPPWDNDALTLSDVDAALDETVPSYRRMLQLEQTLPSVMEFTVWETISPGAAVAGCLMGEGWEPPASLLERQPLSEEALRTHLRIMP